MSTTTTNKPATTTTRRRPNTKTVTVRKTTPKAVATPKKAAATPKATKVEPNLPDNSRFGLIEEDLKDWSYLSDKEATELHADMSKFLEELTGVPMDLKTVQIVSIMRHVYQRSGRNKNRGAYRGLDEAVVNQRSTHMIQAHLDAKAEIARRNAIEEAKADAAKNKRAATRKAKA